MTSVLTRPPVDLEVIFPAFNEEHRLPSTVSTAVDHLARCPWSSAVVVVDNDSGDRTHDVLDGYGAAGVEVYAIGCSDHGKGAAVRRGMATSSARFVGFADADNATPFDTVDQVMPLLRQGHAAVIASRRADGASYEIEQSALRRCGGWMFRALARLTVPDIADTQCGFKFFDGPLVREVIDDCRIDGFAFDVEILARLARRGHRATEVPVAWSDVPGSTFSARRDGLRSMADLIRISLAR
ncbi:glycosyltransferase [Streptomyces sp. NA04227]|uniref:glycosyltransferase n=1 Tax=Streptomyces sp. NA04227 TaxID=2742136 RepID=UPI0015924B48|nr:glycosyltransferase [Streptomyces sp. NA04227]QKW09733.1 glycosyltransferase [Streptomyces sp. NA04227]